jgi:hypothetical protein
VPVEQLGFRRLLAGIYAHTGKHIIAAPMAHYMAMQGSRFSFSHDTCHFPIIGIDAILQQKDMVMGFREVNGTQIPFHKAMHYPLRPLLMEAMCSYEFFRDVEFLSRTQAEKSGRESFEFPGDHPCKENMVVVYRERECVPVFSWRWLGSTADFASTMNESTQKGDQDYAAKEEYAYKFMLLFLPFRIDENLRMDGSYLRRWQIAYERQEFRQDMVDVADNIQTISNSLQSTNPDSGTLDSETFLDHVDECGPKKKRAQEGDEIENILASIGDYFAATEDSVPMEEDAMQIDRTFAGKFLKGRQEADASIAFNSVIQYEQPDDVIVQQHQLTKPKYGRWTTPVSELNALAMSHRLVSTNDRERNEIDGNETQEVNNYVNANGTSESIVLWGQIAGMDPEQQCAFEILSATYVLTFYDDATFEVGMDLGGFPDQKEKLYKLARRKANSNPLIMFVTGAAGAGKCKQPKALV